MGLENINYKFIEKNQYVESLNTLNDSINLILDEFKNLYVITNMHPDNQEYQQLFENCKANINQIQGKLFTITNNIQSDTNKINSSLLEVDTSIKVERNTNKELKQKLGIIEHKNNSASEMIDNYKEMYDSNYLRNWSLSLSTILCIITIGIVYKKQGV
jgi:hypothetical protein